MKVPLNPRMLIFQLRVAWLLPEVEAVAWNKNRPSLRSAPQTLARTEEMNNLIGLRGHLGKLDSFKNLSVLFPYGSFQTIFEGGLIRVADNLFAFDLHTGTF